MKLVIAFGLAGSGKTYVANLLAARASFHAEDADDWMPSEMRNEIIAQRDISEAMILRFTNVIIQRIQKLQEQGHKRLVVSQGLYRSEARQKILRAFPTAVFLQITARNEVIQSRLLARNNWVNWQYANRISKYFQPMPRTHVIDNNADGDASLLEQLRAMPLLFLC